MPGCIYKIRDRVMVPTVDGVQGIITSCLESIESESVYTIRWFDLNAVPVSEHFKESDVMTANVPSKTFLPDVTFAAGETTKATKAARTAKIKRSRK